MSISSIGGVSPLSALMGIGAALLKADETEKSRSPRADFLEIARQTPAERMRAALLARMGLEEKDLAGMTADQREAVENKIKEMIKADFEAGADKRPGRIVDLKA
ncbi:MAG: hypothetical protein V4466_00555 [Pseudomonadota bacterium]